MTRKTKAFWIGSVAPVITLWVWVLLAWVLGGFRVMDHWTAFVFFTGPSIVVGGLTGMIASVCTGGPPMSRKPLGIVLAVAAKHRFSELIHAIDFIAHDGVQTDVPDDAIKEAYFRVDVDIEELTSDLNTQTRQGFVEGHKRIQEVHAEYVPPLRFKRVEGWLNHAGALSKEQDATTAMVKYMDMLRESRKAHTIIHEAATQLDLAIEHAINVRLGK